MKKMVSIQSNTEWLLYLGFTMPHAMKMKVQRSVLVSWLYI